MRSNNKGIALALCGIFTAVVATFLGVWLLIPPPVEVPEVRVSEPREAPREVHRVFNRTATVPPSEPVVFEEEPDFEEWPEDALPDELLVAFGSSRELERFYQNIRGSDIEVVGVIDGLNAVRVRFPPGAEGDVREAAEGGEIAHNFRAGNPEMPEWDGTPGRGTRAGESLDGDTLWGEGVRIAVLDTGVARHPSVEHALVGEINLVGDGPDYAVGTHGTAVASVIAGAGEVGGVAPGAEILSIRILDENGLGNTFFLAQGIVEAANSGVDFITVSLGSPGTNFLLDDAIAYARSQGTVIVAAAGNDGQGQLMYPARHPDVVGVTALDDRGLLAPFSNYGEGVGITAPGVNLLAAQGNEGVFHFTGTSAANPYAVGGMAATMGAFPGITPDESLGYVTQYADDTGPAGPDPYHGHGKVNFRRALEHATPGIMDLAVTGHFYMQTAEDGSIGVQVPIQNRGTEAVNNVRLQVRINGQPQTFHIGRLEPTEVKAEFLPLDRFRGQVRVESSVEAPFVNETDLQNNHFGTAFNMDAVR